MATDYSPDFEDLWHQTQTDLRGAISVVERIGQLAPELNVAPRLTRLDEELAKVTTLELRLAVVAPMNAGKSTLINAILQTDQLPRRNAAMTTLPVEVVEDVNLDEPRLLLESDLLNAVDRAALEVDRIVGRIGRTEAIERLRRHPHLVPMLDRNDRWQPVVSPCTGSDINRALFFVNDIVRVLDNIAPTSDKLEPLKSAPPARLATVSTRSPREVGRLVVVDTPGPNEGSASILDDVVSRELERATLVLLVLDYSQLHAEAAEKLRKNVSDIADRRGTDALFVVVNKVDQRRSEHDMSQEEVRDFVTSTLGMADLDPAEHLFETKALFALNSSLILDSNDFSSPLTQDHLRELLPGPVFNQIATLPENVLRGIIENYRADSGLPELMNSAIETMRAEAGHQVLRSGDRLALAELRSVLANLIVRQRSLEAEQKDLEAALRELKSQLAQIPKLTRQIAARADKQRVAFVTKLDQHSERLSLRIDSDLKSLFEPKSLFKRFTRHGRQADKPTVRDFDKEQEAQHFADSAISAAVDHVNARTDEWSRRAYRDLRKTRNALEREVKAQLQPVVNAAQRTLKTHLNLAAGWPESLPKTALQPLQFNPHAKPHTEKGRAAVTETAYRHRFLFIKWGRYQRVVRPGTKDKHWTTYQVDLQTLRDTVSKWKAEHIGELREKVNTWVDEELQGALTKLVEATTDYLRRYEASLEASLADKAKSQDAQRQQLRELADVQAEVNRLCGGLQVRVDPNSRRTSS